jgi:hypothetical protein
MPATDLISPFVVSCAGGLTLNKDVFSMQPGEALILQNFEPDIKGGYRRVSGSSLYNTTIIPQGSSNASFNVDCSIVFNNQIIVGRGGDIHRVDTTGGYTTLTSGLGTSTRAYDFEKFNFNGTNKIVIATGHSAAQIINSSFAVDVVNATGGGTAPSNPKFVKAFQNHMFYAGATNPEEVIFSVPFEEDNFTSGTARIGDVELGSISRQIQTRIDEVGLNRISSIVIRSKSQYRLFYPVTAAAQGASKGIIGVLKSNANTGQIGFEYADIVGMKPACTDSDFINGVETQVFGGFDGFLYKMEVGNTFAEGSNNNTIQAVYRSPDMVMGDPGIRKNMQRVNLNYQGEGTSIDANLALRYNYDDQNSPQPAKIALPSVGGAGQYGAASYGNALYNASGVPLVRQTVEGSGFAVALQIDDQNSADSFSIKGFQLEFTPGGRR